MAIRHDYFKQECPNSEPEIIGTYSNGIIIIDSKTEIIFAQKIHLQNLITPEIPQQH